MHAALLRDPASLATSAPDTPFAARVGLFVRFREALLSGDLLGALAWNPLVFLGLTAVAVWAVLSAARFAFRLPTWRVALSRRERTGARILAIAVFVGGWAWVLWHNG